MASFHPYIYVPGSPVNYRILLLLKAPGPGKALFFLVWLLLVPSFSFFTGFSPPWVNTSLAFSLLGLLPHMATVPTSIACGEFHNLN